MNADQRSINKVLAASIQYLVPLYQRPYSWGEENVVQLLADLWEAFETKNPEYFMGSVITIERERDRLYEIVDGQQRLTTLNLIIAKLRDRIADPASKAFLGNFIRPQDPLTGGMAAPRLLVREKDRDFFEAHVLEGKPLTGKIDALEDAPQRHLAENLQVVDRFCLGTGDPENSAFCQPKSEDQLKAFASYLLAKVSVVFVTTNSFEAAYRLFNVLNARGIALSNADLIKNALFGHLGLPRDHEKERRLDVAWTELEEEVGINDLDAFFSHYRASVTAVKASRNLYEEIYTLIKGNAAGSLAFMAELADTADNYTRIIDVDFKDGGSIRALRSLHRVQYDEWIPPLLAYLKNPISGMSEPEFFELVEKITIQNWVRRLGRTAGKKVYFELIRAIKDGRNADEVRQIFRSNADNEEFITLLGGDLYGKTYATAILFRLDEVDLDNAVVATFTGRNTIEHVLPQSLKDEYWKKQFTEKQHREWLHRLGNLTLLAGYKNSSAKDKSFAEKLKTYSKVRNVSFNRTRELLDYKEWTVETIRQRHERMLGLARLAWFIN